MRTRIVFSAAVAALALVVAGCGGSDEADDPTAAWAAFCSAVTNWTDELQTITSEFTDTSNLSQEGLETAAEDARASTDQLVDELRGLGAPETESAKRSSPPWTPSRDPRGRVRRDRRHGRRHLDHRRHPRRGVEHHRVLSAMGSAFSSTLQTIESADAEDELQIALEDSHPSAPTSRASDAQPMCDRASSDSR